MTIGVDDANIGRILKRQTYLSGVSNRKNSHIRLVHSHSSLFNPGLVPWNLLSPKPRHKLHILKSRISYGILWNLFVRMFRFLTWESENDKNLPQYIHVTVFSLEYLPKPSAVLHVNSTAIQLEQPLPAATTAFPLSRHWSQRYKTMYIGTRLK